MSLAQDAGPLKADPGGLSPLPDILKESIIRKMQQPDPMAPKISQELLQEKSVPGWDFQRIGISSFSLDTNCSHRMDLPQSVNS